MRVPSFWTWLESSDPTYGLKPGDIVNHDGRPGIVTWIGKRAYQMSVTGQNTVDVGMIAQSEPRYQAAVQYLVQQVQSGQWNNQDFQDKFTSNSYPSYQMKPTGKNVIEMAKTGDTAGIQQATGVKVEPAQQQGGGGQGGKETLYRMSQDRGSFVFTPVQ